MPILKPNPGQQEFALRQPYSIKEILYGGARGGGKTFAGIIWLTEYIDNPRFQGLVIRRNANDLSDWIERAKYVYSGLNAVFTGGTNAIIRFPSGAIIRTGHLKDDDTYTKYQGHEYQKMLIEELNQIPSEERYLRLISSCRTSIKELKPQIFATTNPGGVGHLWVKQRFIDPSPPNVRFIGDDGMSRIFIPATMDDNPVLMEADPDYVKTIEALRFTDEALYRAWRFGDWDIFVGQVYKEWRVKEHTLPYLPRGLKLEDCKLYIGLDWGYRDPASVHWIAATPENELGIRHYYIYREIYVTEQRPSWLATEIAEIVKDEPVEFLIMPHDTYANLGGTRPIEQQFRETFKTLGVSISMIPAEAQSHRAKINRQALMHEALSLAPDDIPYVRVLENCRNLIRTLPALSYSDTKPEEIDSEAEDHAFDSVTYGLYRLLNGKSLIVNPKGIVDKQKQGYIVNEEGKLEGFHVDLGKVMKNNKDQDWRYR